MKAEEQILQLFARTVARGLGLFDNKTRRLASYDSLPAGGQGLYRENRDQIRGLLRQGWTQVDLEARIRDAHRNHITARFVRELLASGDGPTRRDLDRELMTAGAAVLHPLLKYVSPPRFIGGVIVRGGAPQARESFTLRDLIAHYQAAFPVLPGMAPEAPERLAGAFAYLLDGCSLDEVLFAIDAAAEAAKSADAAPIGTPLDLMRYRRAVMLEVTHRRLRCAAPRPRPQREKAEGSV